VPGIGSEKLDDDLKLLGSVIVVQIDLPGQYPSGFSSRHFMILLNNFNELEVTFVTGVSFHGWHL
jgi:hypothetical protein